MKKNVTQWLVIAVTAFASMSCVACKMVYSPAPVPQTESSMSIRKGWITCAHRGNVVGTNLHENTLAAFYLAAKMGCDIVECDARACADGTLVCNHFGTGTDIKGHEYTIAQLSGEEATRIVLSRDSVYGVQYLPTLEQVLNVCYHEGIGCNIDLKNSAAYATAVARMVLRCGMQGKVYYATNQAPYTTIEDIAAIDEGARFIGSMKMYTDSFLNQLPRDLRQRCIIYTHRPDDVPVIRARGAAALLTNVTRENIEACLNYHPEILEYQHTTDFRAIEDDIKKTVKPYLMTQPASGQ